MTKASTMLCQLIISSIVEPDFTNVSSATDTPASAMRATLAALRPKNAASTYLLFLNFSNILDMMIMILILGAIRPRVAIIHPSIPAVSQPP